MPKPHARCCSEWTIEGVSYASIRRSVFEASRSGQMDRIMEIIVDVISMPWMAMSRKRPRGLLDDGRTLFNGAAGTSRCTFLSSLNKRLDYHPRRTHYTGQVSKTGMEACREETLQST